MWTEITRRQYRRDGLRYASDMTDGEWALIEPFMPSRRRLGGRARRCLRAVVNALLYICSDGLPVAAAAEGFSAAIRRCSGYFYRWRADGLWADGSTTRWSMAAREREGREASPSAPG